MDQSPVDENSPRGLTVTGTEPLAGVPFGEPVAVDPVCLTLCCPVGAELGHVGVGQLLEKQVGVAVTSDERVPRVAGFDHGISLACRRAERSGRLAPADDPNLEVSGQPASAACLSWLRETRSG